MKRSFDILTQTLTDVTAEDYKAAMMKEVRLDPPAAIAGTPVPKGRTTFKIDNPPPIATPSENDRQSLPRPTIPQVTEPQTPPPFPAQPRQTTGTERQEPQANETNYLNDIRPSESVVIDGNIPPASPQIVVGDFHPPAGTAAAYVPTPRSEAAAVLHVRAMQPKKPKTHPQPNDMVLMNFRLEQFLKDTFDRTCQDRGTIPSVMLRKLIKQYCGL